MAKRITSSRVKRWAIGSGITGIPLAVLLIWYLTTLGVIDVTGISGDMICDGTLEYPCLAFVNFSVKEDIFIYPSENWSATPFYTDIQPKEVTMYRSWGTSWRKIDLTKGCTGSWCGCYWCTKTNTAKFSYVFRKDRDYQLKYVALKNNPNDVIKWGFGPIDPYWYGENESIANISVSNNLTMELGSRVNITTNLSGASTVCVDIDHPDYGDEYACGSPNANFLFNISYFRKTELNDSSTSRELDYPSAQNQTVYINGHQYDEIVNFTINLTGESVSGAYPENVKIYINGSYDQTIGPLRPSGTDVILNQTNASSLPEYILDRVNGTVVRYFAIPSKATINYGVINYTGDASGSQYGGCANSGFCANASGNSTTCNECDDGGTAIPDCLYGCSGGVYEEKYAYDSNVSSIHRSWSQGTTAYSTQIYLNFSNQTATPAYGTWKVKWRGWGADAGAGQGQRTVRFYIWDYKDSTWNLFLSRYCNENTPSSLWCRTEANGGPYTETINFYNSVNSYYFSPDGPVQFLINGTHSGVDSTDESWMYIYESDTVFTGSVSHSNTTGMAWGSTTGTSENVTIEVGAVDGDYEGNYSGDLPWLISQQTINFSDEINSYLSTCAEVAGYCYVPIYFTSPIGAKIKIHDLNITYEHNPNPIQIGLDLIRDFLNSSTNFVNIPIRIYSDSGNITVNDIKYDYAGGNDTIEVFTYDNASMNCYQESANTSDQSGTDGSCSQVYDGNYLCVGTWHSSWPCSNTYDGNWGSSGAYTSGAIYLYVNYTKPVSATNNSQWRVSGWVTGPGKYDTNLSLSSGCWDQSPLQLQVKLFKPDGSTYAINHSCYNGNNWEQLYYYSGGGIGLKFYEEAMWWKVPTDKSKNDTLNLINYFSNWDYDFPSYVDYLEFIPKSWNSQNVTPYGQTSNRPILNISFYNYGDKNANLSIYLNETDSCVNLTIGTTSNKSLGTLLTNGTWTDILTNRPYLNYTGLWMWADMYCNQTYWSWWSPEISFKSCGVDVDYCSTDLN